MKLISSKMQFVTSQFALVRTMHLFGFAINAMLIKFLILAVFNPKFAYSVPQVFSDSYSYCNHEFSNGNNVVFPNKLWTIDGKDFVLYFSFCKSVQPRCRNQTPSCLVTKRDNKIVDLGNEFGAVDSEEFILESLNGAKCPNSDDNYKITVTFECSNSVKLKPRISEEDGCRFEVSMMRPDCRPKCTDLVHNAYIIDIRSFPKSISVQSDSRQFSLSLCGLNRRCGSRDISSCEILNGSYAPLAKVESQSLIYDVGKNELTARGRFKLGREHRELQVLIKCKWEVELNGTKYKKVPTQGRNYKFELESSYGCVKLPQNCVITSVDNLQYDLSSLNNPNGWQVANVPQGKILLNICGPLKQPKNLCSDQYSQVCHIKNNYVNRGSILSSLKIYDDVIRAVFSSGSICLENRQEQYTTEIDFLCSEHEKGPVFKEYRGCVTVLVWESPRACPIDYYTSPNCYMRDRLGNRNLQKLFTETDKIHQLSPRTNNKLVYNLCGPIHTSCNNFSNVSFCLKTGQNRDVVIAWDNRDVISDGGNLKMELTGSTCLNNRSQGKVTVNFICHYEEPSPPPQINIIEDRCKFDVKIFTHLACLSERTFPDCVHNEGDSCYDLSPLVRKDRNYIVPLDQDLEYILNVCGPIISGPGVLCRGNTMSCLRNKTEVNIKHQFTSLGVVSTPTFRNNSLIIESKMGTYCREIGYYKTLIYFECSQNRSPPRFLSKEPCTYKFEWRTPEACPVRQTCVVHSSKPDSQLDLGGLEEKLLKVNVGNGTTKYEFNLCADIYTQSVGGNSNKYPLKRDFYRQNETLYLVLDLAENCDNITIKKVIFEFECDHRTKDYYEDKSFDNCVLSMIVRSRMACVTEHDKFLYSVEDSIDPTLAPIENTELPFVSSKIVENKCLVESQDGDYVFKIKELKPKEVSYGRNNYSINFDGRFTRCRGLVCRNNIPILTTNSCPIISFNNTHSIVKLHFFTHSLCNSTDSFDLEVWLRCNPSNSAEKIIKNETCNLIMEYSLPEACHLLSTKTVPTAEIIGGVIGGVVLLSAVLVIIYLNRKHCRRFQYLNLRNYSKTSIPIYTRDSTE